MDSPGGLNIQGPPSIDHSNGGLNLSDAFDEAARKHSEEKGKQRSIPGGRKKRRRKSRRKSRKSKRLEVPRKNLKSVESHAESLAKRKENHARVKRSVRHVERRNLDVAADKH